MGDYELLAILGLYILCFWAMIQNKAIDEMLLDDYTSCEGIEHFCCTGDLFSDVNMIENRTTYIVTVLPKTPEEYFKTGGDCKSKAKVIMCLCKEYGANCTYYYTVEPASHVGVIYTPDNRTEVSTLLVTLG